jgi:molecular chaperone GrpE (heat shock protein)
LAVGCLAAAAWAAWFSILPWLTQHKTSASLEETTHLKNSMEQLRDLESIAQLIRTANSQWQGAHEAATRTVGAASEIQERMKAETSDFMSFLQRANDQERANLRLEVEKLRKMEGDWLKTTVQILDHIYALNQAAARSGQETLVAQLAQFQSACREVARRMGLIPYLPAPSELFNSQAHQLPDPQFSPPENSRIGEILATGFTYQGQLLRRALVLLEEPNTASEPERVESVPIFKDEPVQSSEPEQTGEEVQEPARSGFEPETRSDLQSPSSQAQLPLV